MSNYATTPSKPFSDLIEKVEEPYRTLLRMRYVKRATVEQIAKHYLIPLENVQEDMVRAHDAWHQRATDLGNEFDLLPSDDSPYYLRAIDLVMETEEATASLLQRKLKIGWFRATRLLDQMHLDGFIGPPNGGKPRKFLLPNISISGS